MNILQAMQILWLDHTQTKVLYEIKEFENGQERIFGIIYYQLGMAMIIGTINYQLGIVIVTKK